MSPTAQPDGRSFQAAAGASERIKPSNTSDSIGTATNLRSNLTPTSEGSVNGQKKTIMILSIGYDDLFQRHGTPAKLRSVRNDLDLLLYRHNYRHNGTEEEFLIYIDYDHEYTDSSGISAPLPRREASKPEVLAGLLEVITRGGSAVIYYSGHGGVERGGPSYIIASDGKRIVGKEFWAVIKKAPIGCTITMVFDACNIGAFFEDVIPFRYIYRAANDNGGSEAPPQDEARGSQTQVIFVAAAQLGQYARTFQQDGNPNEENGAVTVLMDEFFEARRASRPAQALVEKLYRGCHEGQQTPRLYSLFRIVGDFELLP